MASKKKSGQKKHRFKTANISPEMDVTPERRPVAKDNSAVAAIIYDSSDFAYVKGDVVRVALLAALLAVMQLGLWYAFGNTALGDLIYGFFRPQ